MNFKQIINDIFTWEPENSYKFKLPENGYDTDAVSDSLVENLNEAKNIFDSIDVNLEYLKTRYNTLINSDILIREFTLSARNRQYKAFLLFIDGMVNNDLINDFVLNPLMLRNIANSYEGDQDRVVLEAKTNNITVRKVKKFDLLDYINNCLLPQNGLKTTNSFDEIVDAINSGDCALFIDTLNVAFDIDVKGFKQRNVDTPQNEIVIKGPHEAFVENLKTNTSLIRRIINNENLIIENIQVGKITKTKCAVCYMKNLSNSDLVSEVQYRLNNLDIDSLVSIGELEQLIVDSNNLSISRLISTERPDTASKFLLQGRVIIIVNGSPFALVAPSTIIDFLSTPEDTNMKTPFSNFLKGIRLLATVITLLLPGIYVAIASFHQEIFPTELLFTILAARENVPFPVIVELLLLELAFELIREAGLRVPSAISFTIGIVGALIIGDAAVSANIVSPTLLIIVAITGIASAAIPDYLFSFHLRIFKFLFILLGYMAGFLGISLGLFVYITMLTGINSFGVSMTIPIAPSVSSKHNKYFISSIWKREYRPEYFDPKVQKEQAHISMKWKKH